MIVVLKKNIEVQNLTEVKYSFRIDYAILQIYFNKQALFLEKNIIFALQN